MKEIEVKSDLDDQKYSAEQMMGLGKEKFEQIGMELLRNRNTVPSVLH